jgi:hypothetical protein
MPGAFAVAGHSPNSAEAFNAALAEGRVMTWEQAIVWALEGDVAT